MAWRSLGLSLREMGPRRSAEKAQVRESLSPGTSLGGQGRGGAEHIRLSEVLAGRARTLRPREFKPGPRAATGAQPVPRLPHTASPPTLCGRSPSRGSPRAVALQPPAVFSSPRATGATLGDSADPRRRRRLEKGLRSTARTRVRLSDSSWSHQACPGDSSPAPGAHGAALGP